MSTVRHNLMTRKGYTPYCGHDPRDGDQHCPGGYPRTFFNGEQFQCGSCGWISDFPEDFIKNYVEYWGGLPVVIRNIATKINSY